MELWVSADSKKKVDDRRTKPKHKNRMGKSKEGWGGETKEGVVNQSIRDA